MKETDALSLHACLKALSAGVGSSFRARGTLISHMYAAKRVMELIVTYGASNVIRRAQEYGYELEDGSKDPPNWKWRRFAVAPPRQIVDMNNAVERMGQAMENIGRRMSTALTPSGTRIIQPSDPNYHELTSSVHSKGMDTTRGQKCGCAVCEEYREMQEEKKIEASGSVSRWSLLEID